MAKLLITGGAGFIGSNLVEAFVRAGDKVVVVDDFSTGARRNLQDLKPSECKVIEGDIRDVALLKKAAKGCDYLLHLASHPSIPDSVEDPQASIDVAVNGTLAALIAARDMKVKRFIYASSSAVYGESPVLPKEESMLASPNTPYGAGALMGEELARVFYMSYRLETVCLRLFNVYGPRQAVTGSHAGVVGRFCANVLREEKTTVFGDGKQSRDFVHIDDVVEAFRLACTAPKAEGEVFNIASGSRVSIGGMLTLFANLLDEELNTNYIDGRQADVRHALGEILKAQEVLGFRPRVSFAEGLTKTLIWYKKNLGKGLRITKRL